MKFENEKWTQDTTNNSGPPGKVVTGFSHMGGELQGNGKGYLKRTM